MSKIPTTAELLKDKTQFGTYGNMYKREDVSKKMIEFAKLHVEAALEEAKNLLKDGYVTPQDEQDILNAYPLTNIK